MRSISFILPLFLISTLPIDAQEKEPQKLERFQLKLKPSKVESTDGELTKLQKERYNAALEVVELHLLRIEMGRDSVAGVGLAVDRLIQSGVELDSAAKDRQELLEEAVRFSKHVEEVVNRQYNAGFVTKSDLALSRYARLNAEIRLLKEKENGKK